jgi:hypothetical protein
METATQQKTVTFYLTAGQRADKDGGYYPSSTIIRISGGERLMSKDGARFIAPMKEARFSNGTFTTDDPETIQTLRRLALTDSNLTENYEVYANRTLTTKQRLARNERIQGDQLTENSRLKATIERMKKQGKKDDEVPQ